MKSVNSNNAWINKSGRGYPGLTRFCSLYLVIAVLGSALVVVGCGRSDFPPPFDPSELIPGGAASVGIKPFPSLELPSANLPSDQLPHFHAGKALAHQPWVKAPTVTDARDGLGPIYNARTCLACHINGGRGEMPQDSNTAIFSALVRISVPGRDDHNGPVPEPTYGLQMQAQSVSLQHQFRHHPPAKKVSEAPPEANIYLDWQTQTVTYPDGQTIQLRSPKLRFENLGYGSMSESLLTSLRSAPSIAGMGLLELIDQADLDLLADPEDENRDGISGRVNQVWSEQQQKTLPGRFGWKANRATLAETVAGAFQQDIGISNPMFPAQPCTQQQPLCLAMAVGNNSNGFELSQDLLDLVVDFTRNLAVPVVRAADAEASQLKQGRAQFYQLGCAGCHWPSFQTKVVAGAQAHLGGQTIWPYTDLLLHDLGPGLADGRPDFAASGREWRTPPLWGVGLNEQVNGHGFYLHDGRARSVEEAILWHGGEAANSQQQFMKLSHQQRQDVIKFVETR